MEKVYILTEKGSTQEYCPVEISTDSNVLLEGLEYGDISEDTFQLWEYPSGKIFSVGTDRKVAESLYYSTSKTKNGVNWLPTLSLLYEDEAKVRDAKRELDKAPSKIPIMSRLFRKWPGKQG